MTQPRRTDDALCAYEREILAHWDAGRSLADICALTGRSHKTVRTITSLYDDRPDDHDPLRLANVQFVKRLRQVHGALIGLRA